MKLSLDGIKDQLVALLAEGVDRNWKKMHEAARDTAVALLAEGVDRNILGGSMLHGVPGSPSSQRAWIEIRFSYHRRTGRPVALLAEGVDRNIVHNAADYNNAESPSSQRAWIEITTPSGTSARSTSPSSQRAWIEIT